MTCRCDCRACALARTGWAILIGVLVGLCVGGAVLVWL